MKHKLISPYFKKNKSFIRSGLGGYDYGKVHSFKFEVEKFNGNNKFQLWKLKMRDLLVQQGLQKDLVGKSKKSTNMKNED